MSDDFDEVSRYVEFSHISYSAARITLLNVFFKSIKYFRSRLSVEGVAYTEF